MLTKPLQLKVSHVSKIPNELRTYVSTGTEPDSSLPGGVNSTVLACPPGLESAS